MNELATDVKTLKYEGDDIPEKIHNPRYVFFSAKIATYFNILPT